MLMQKLNNILNNGNNNHYHNHKLPTNLSGHFSHFELEFPVREVSEVVGLRIVEEENVGDVELNNLAPLT